MSRYSQAPAVCHAMSWTHTNSDYFPVQVPCKGHAQEQAKKDGAAHARAAAALKDMDAAVAAAKAQIKVLWNELQSAEAAMASQIHVLSSWVLADVLWVLTV